MDRELIAALWALIGTVLAGAFCWWSFQRGRSRYVPVADTLHESLQEFLNAVVWMAAFTSVFMIVIQPAQAMEFGRPSGWAALVGGLLAMATVHSPLMQTIRGWMEGFSLSTERSLFRERLGREMARARQDRRVLLATAPFFTAVVVYVALQLDSENTAFVYLNSVMQGYVHVISALTAVIGWKALGNLQHDIRSGQTDAIVIDETSHPAPVTDASKPLEADAVERPVPPFHIRFAKLAYEAVTGGAVGAAIWFGMPYTTSLPWPLWTACWSLAAIGAVVLWHRIDSLWKPSAALGLFVAMGIVAIGAALVHQAGVHEEVAWGVGGGVGLLLLQIALPDDARWRSWIRPERERWEFGTSLVGIVVILALSSTVYRVFEDQGELIFSGIATVFATVAWIRVPSRLMSYSALFIALVSFGLPLIVLIDQPGLGFGFWFAVMSLDKLRERFGPSPDDNDGRSQANAWSPRSLMRFNPFTNERRDLLTHLTPEECVSSIERGTYEPLGGRRRLTHHTPEEEAQLPPIEAHASVTRLSLARFRRYRTNIWTVATATMTVTPDGTLIRARAGMHSGFRFLYVLPVLLIGPVLVAVPVIVARDPSRIGEGVSAAIGALVLSGIAIAAPRALDDESRELLDFLQETLDAEVVIQSFGSQPIADPFAG